MKSKKIKNQALFKKGGYAILVTSLVLIALIVVNVLLSVLSDRVNLEIDMTEDKINSIEPENIEYLESIKSPVEIIVCAKEDEYANYLANYYYSSISGGLDYYNQTITLLNKYPLYSDEITLRFVDTQSSEFTEISQNYSTYKPTYGDILVVATSGENTRVRKVSYTDMYYIDTENASMYGYSISGNNMETALTNAIAYVLTGKTKKAMFITGHSMSNNTANYKALLEANNYTVELNSADMITSIDKSYDLVAIMSASRDFAGSEIDALNQFLDNDDKYGKGLVYFADANCPSLPNLNAFLDEWGIIVEEGMVFETDTNLHAAGDPSTFVSVPAPDGNDNDETTRDPISADDNIGQCLSGANVPIRVKNTPDGALKVSSVATTYGETAVAAPVGAAADWKDYTENDLTKYTTLAVAEMLDYDNDNNPLKSYVVAFSSVQIIQSQWAEYGGSSNKDLVIWASDLAAGVTESGQTFVSKVLGAESYAADITESNVKTVRWIFVIIIPIAIIAAGVVIFFRRKNAE